MTDRIIVTLPMLPSGRWERKGECNHCGYCCQYIGQTRSLILTLPSLDGTEHPMTQDDVRFYELRGGIKTPHGNVYFRTDAFAPCAAHNTADSRCEIYQDRPNVCREYPVNPEQIEFTPCSYYFEFLDGAGSVVRRGGGSPYPAPETYPSDDPVSLRALVGRLMARADESEAGA